MGMREKMKEKRIPLTRVLPNVCGLTNNRK